MAKIIEETITIKVSKLVKDSDAKSAEFASADILVNLEAIAQELFGADVIVEIEKS